MSPFYIAAFKTVIYYLLLLVTVQFVPDLKFLMEPLFVAGTFTGNYVYHKWLEPHLKTS